MLSNYKYKQHESQWKPILIDDVFGSAYVVSKHGNCVHKITGVSYENSLTKSALAWSCLEEYLKEENKSFYTPKDKYIRNFIRETVKGGRVIAWIRKFVSSLFNKINKILEKHSEKN